MKKKKRNFIIKIFSLLLLGIISITLLGSWSYDFNTDTITSDNLFSIDLISTTDTYQYMRLDSNTTYTISINDKNISNNEYFGITKNVNNPQSSGYLWLIENGLIRYNTYTFNSIDYDYIFIYPKNGNITNYYDIMLNVGSTALPYEPYGQTYVNQQRLDDLELDYDDLAEQYSNLYDEYETLQSNYNSLQTTYDNYVSNHTYTNQQYNTLYEQYQVAQQQVLDLNSQIANLSKISSNLYNLFYHCDIYVFEDTTNKGIDYYSSHLNEADSSFMHLVISSTAISFNYDMLPDYIRSFISSSEDYCYILFKFNNTDLNGLYNIFFNDYTFDFEVQLFNDVTSQKYIYNMQDNGSLSNAIVIDTNNILYNYLLFDSTMDYHFTKFYTSDFTNVYNQGYENGIRQNYLVIDDLRSQVNIASNTITSLRRQIDSLNEQLANNIGWKPLFFAMADTPFKVVSNVLGFEVFGVNLFKVFVGIITGLAIILLLKKLLGK